MEIGTLDKAIIRSQQKQLKWNKHNKTLLIQQMHEVNQNASIKPNN